MRQKHVGGAVVAFAEGTPIRSVAPFHFAFTLIGLLVVIAVIAILTSLLLPSLAAAKDKGQRTAIANNLRHLMVATVLYDDDEKVLPMGWKPPSRGFGWFVFDPWGTTNWLTALRQEIVWAVVVPRRDADLCSGAGIGGEPSEVRKPLCFMAPLCNREPVGRSTRIAFVRRWQKRCIRPTSKWTVQQS